jgi:hypothetical protein
MRDIFNVIQDTNKYEESAFEYTKNILNCDSILTLQIDWAKYQHIFYIEQININKICDLVIINLDVLNLYELNIKFGIINRLNGSFNQIMNCNNYTLYRLQDVYINQVIANNKIANIWFDYIINTNLSEINSTKFIEPMVF